MNEEATEVPARRGRWGRAVGYGLLAEVATIITIVMIVVVYKQLVARGLSDTEYAAFGQRVGGLIGIVGGTVYTFLFARMLMPKLSWHFIGHGLVVAAAAIILSVGGSLLGHQGVPAGYLWASVLKLSAGALAGFLYSRRPRHNQPGA